MNRDKVRFISLEEDRKKNTGWWLSQPVEKRFYAIEFLRHQYMEMNGIEPVMDKQYFDVF